MSRPQARVLTLAFTDLESSSRRWEDEGSAFQARLNRHFELLREDLERHGGHEVKSLGDGLFVAFDLPEDGLRYALNGQRRLRAEGAVPARIGLHVGTVYEQAGPDGRIDYFGPATNRAARICGVCPPGCVLLSDAMRAMLPRLGDDVSLIDCGPVELRGVGQERLWRLCHPEIGDADPASGAMVAPGLPGATTSFVGREAWMDRIEAAMREERCVALVGQGGVGKSRLALEVAHRLREDFAGGVVFVEIDGVRDEEVVLAGLGSVLRPLGGGAGATLRDALVFLAEREVLLVLDGSEAFEGTAGLVHTLVARTARVRLLVTSRHRARLPGRAFEVGPLGAEDATRMLIDRARSAGEEIEMDATVRLLTERLERLPLAIELAAARLAVMTPAQMLGRIESSLEWLGETGEGGGRKGSLLATIRWSFEMLSEEGRQALLQASIFSGPFRLDGWERIAGARAIERLSELRRNSFVAVEGDDARRFRLPASVRRFAFDRLTKDVALFEGTAERHAEAFLRRADERLALVRSADEAEALSELQEDAGDLRAAAENMRRLGRPSRAAALGASLGELLHLRGENRRALGLAEEARRDLAEAEDPLRGWVLRLCAVCALDAGRVETAAEAVEAALAMDARDARALNLRGLVATAQGRQDEADRAYRAALACADAAGDRETAAMVAHNLGFLAFGEEAPDLGAAEGWWERALAIRRARGDERGVAETTGNLGLLRLSQGDESAAWRLQSEALAANGRLHDIEGVGRSLFNLAGIAERSDGTAAIRLYAAALGAFHATESTHRAVAEGALARFGSAGATLREEALRQKAEDFIGWSGVDAA